MILFEQTLQK